MKILTILIISLTATFSSAQLFDDLDNVLAASTKDANILFEAYTAPLGESFTYALNSGWASSAKTHKKLGIDLTIGLASPSVSDAAKSFSINKLNLEQLTSTASSANTVFGAKGSTTFTYTLPGTSTSQSVNIPGGLEDKLVMNSLPVPYLQAGVGLFFNTDVIVRYLPKFESQGAQVDVFGVGLKHNLMQYFGLFDKLPLNVSLLGSYTSLNVKYGLSNAYPNQQISAEVNTYMIQALGSLDFPVISIVGGFGYGKGDAAFDMLGDYTISLADGTSKTRSNPLSSDKSYTGTHAMIGARANLLFLKIFANYTLQEFNTLNVGVSVNFR
jgi:hypothetical protein